MTSFVTAATYSALVVDNITTPCNLLDQLTAPVPTLITIPLVDFLVDLSPTKSASV